MQDKFDHSLPPLEDGRHPEFKHLVLFEIQEHHTCYILTAQGHEGSALLSEDDAKHMFEDQFEDEFAYLTDEYLQLLERL